MEHNKLTGRHTLAVVYAFLAAAFYAVNVPCSKLLLNNIGPTFLAGLLYIGAGTGVALMYLCRRDRGEKNDRLTRHELPYTIAMVVLDIAAPILLMLGVSKGSAGNASLLGNFEIVATTVIALFIFKEKVGIRLWSAIFLITVSSIILSFDMEFSLSSMEFSSASLFVLGATVCWGLENNCTRKISSKSTYEIVTIKGLCSGAGSIIISLLIGESVPEIKYICLALVLGFISYGLSIFTYIRAQNVLGAAKTSAYYAVAPFIGGLLSFVILREVPALNFYIALLVMTAGVVLVVMDTMKTQKPLYHIHIITHTHDGYTHTHQIIHDHDHKHKVLEDGNSHIHSIEELEEEAHKN